MEKKRIISLGIAGLSLALAASITATVAWYTGSTYLAITNIEIRSKDPNLLISVDNVNFSETIEKSKLPSVKQFGAVSSMFSNEWLETKNPRPIFKTGNTVGSGYIFNKSTDFKNASDGFFQQTFYLKCDIDAYVTFDSELTNFVPDKAGNQTMLENAGFMNTMEAMFPNLSRTELEKVVIERLESVVKSMRFSILVLDTNSADDYDDYKYYIYDPNKTEYTLLGGILDTTNSGYYDTYNHKEVLYGDIYSNNPALPNIEDCIVYDDELLQGTLNYPREQQTCFNANNAQGDKKVNFGLSEERGMRIKVENSLGPNEVEEKMLIPVQSNETRKIVLSFYQEGWDKDNTNFIVYSQFLVNMQLKIAPVQPRP